jgi:hypothetical protein
MAKKREGTPAQASNQGTVAANTTPTPDPQASLDFLNQYRPDGPWVLTAIGVDKRQITTVTFRSAQEAELREWLAKNAHRNIYFHVNPTLGDLTKKAERSDIDRLAWLHVDVDPRAGEDLDAERERALRRLTTELPEGVPPPTAVIFSGGGYQAFWRLTDGMHIGGDEALYEEAKLYNLQLEILFGADNCHNVDRIMRLPGTVNHPDDKKQRKGRTPQLAQVVAFTDAEYPLGTFTKAPPVAPTARKGRQGTEPTRLVIDTAKAKVSVIKTVDDLPDSIPDLCQVVIVQGFDPDEPKRFPSRSEALLYVCCELVRREVPDEDILAVITNPNFKISESVLDKKGSAEKYAIRQIERAHDIAIDKDLAKLNDRYAVIASIGGKCRVIHEDEDIALGRPRIVKQAFEDFRNSLMHRKKVVGQNKDGLDIKKPLGHWWLEHEHRRQFDTMTFAPGKEQSGVFNLWRGFAVEPGGTGSCDLYLAHVRENVCGGDTAIYDFVLGWMANMVQNPGEPGHSAIVLRGRAGCWQVLLREAPGQTARAALPLRHPGQSPCGPLQRALAGLRAVVRR